VLRELTSAASEQKMFTLNEKLEINSGKLIELNEANEKSAACLYLIVVAVSAQIAWGILDRFTGDWTVVNSDWMLGIYEGLVKSAYMWFMISLFLWMIVMILMTRTFKMVMKLNGGVTIVRVTYNKKVFKQKMADFLMMKTTTNQSYNIENGDMFKQPREIVRTSYVEPNATWGGRSDIGVSLTSALWGASSITRITIEYDRNNEFLLNATIWYNRHRADQNLALTETELREKLEEDFNTHGIFDENLKEEYAKEALAVEKREALNEKIEEGEDEDEEEED